MFFDKLFLNLEYCYILIYFILGCFLGIVLFVLSFGGALRQWDFEKTSAYECGFSPFEDARNCFDVSYYLIAILFIVFDLEITFLFPWCVTLGYIGFFGYWIMIFFLYLLCFGFLYEWSVGALNW
jgi:NADH:ubiquinone oxidoreductase subunit 3 (subunit A)